MATLAAAKVQHPLARPEVQDVTDKFRLGLGTLWRQQVPVDFQIVPSKKGFIPLGFVLDHRMKGPAGDSDVNRRGTG